jgi:hypothetical protein
LIHRQLITMCSHFGRELYSTRQLMPPSAAPQSPATPCRPQVGSAGLGCGDGNGIRRVGDVECWQLYALLTERLPHSNGRHYLRCWCPVPDLLEKSSARGGVGEGSGCAEEGSTHPITSRQQGVGLSGRGHGAERQRDDRVPPRTSENSPSMHSGE